MVPTLPFVRSSLVSMSQNSQCPYLLHYSFLRDFGVPESIKGLLAGCRNIFADSGVEWVNYRYFDPTTVGLDFKGMTEDLSNAPKGSVVVLHGEPPCQSSGHCSYKHQRLQQDASFLQPHASS